jgi:competence protein ComEA
MKGCTVDDFLERRRAPIIVGLSVVIVLGIAVIYLRWPRQTPAGALAPSRSAAMTPVVIRTVTPRVIKVYVTGAVVSPGVYSFRDGDRVEDAIQAAGGALGGADLSGLNLAQRLRDEGYIVVTMPGATPGADASSITPGISPTGKVNINTATAKELETLPGIGATYAQRIVDYRTRNGAFQRPQDLVEDKIVPSATYDKIKDLIAVH